jgi:pimeloyl-ACP methyl ester carboxylesterase
MVFQVNGIEMHWEETGEGEPLLWLHGALGSGADWKHIFREPPAGYRLIAPDLRGHGGSTNPSGAFTFRQCAQDVLALLRHLQLPRVKAIGLSGGGLTLLHLATAAPRRDRLDGHRQRRRISRGGACHPAHFGRDDRRGGHGPHARAAHDGEAQVEQLFLMVRGLPTAMTTSISRRRTSRRSPPRR